MQLRPTDALLGISVEDETGLRSSVEDEIGIGVSFDGVVREILFTDGGGWIGVVNEESTGDGFDRFDEEGVCLLSW